MNSPTQPSGFRRKRVLKACRTCRILKCKCDGKRPECGRCKGYGYQCEYGAGRTGHASVVAQSLCEVINDCASLAESLASKINAEERQDALSSLTQIKSRAKLALASESTLVNDRQPQQAPSLEDSTTDGKELAAESKSTHYGRRYLGEVSDVRFFNLIKGVLELQIGTSGLEREVDSYEQDDYVASATTSVSPVTELPGQEDIKSLTDVYFSTIHLAYPFIDRTEFLDRFQKPGASFDATQSALLYTICAIGSYYNSFLANQTHLNDLHEKYFMKALSLTPPTGRDRSLDCVVLSLAQCFYLLAVCRTDSCWTTLGQAVRTAQSVGLHAEPESEPDELDISKVERRRRVWYSIYVLDRLLSLQLGRPPAIHDEDCHVTLPSLISSSEVEPGGKPDASANVDSSSGNYFLAVISFSRLVGHVLRDIYNPKNNHTSEMELCKTRELDQQLMQWKLGLPRALRFDLGHLFDQSLALKRLRNMLAVKYHHLRALMHRPYLCYPLLRRREAFDSALPQSNWPLISVYEKICIVEARSMARLLRGVSSEKDLVHDFPWWQMISCLVCAASILVVSSIFSQQTDDAVNDLDPESLSDDAETCLRVFEALSTNSSGAKFARDMIEKLKESGARWKIGTSGETPNIFCDVTSPDLQGLRPPNMGQTSDTEPFLSQCARVSDSEDTPSAAVVEDRISMPAYWPA